MVVLRRENSAFIALACILHFICCVDLILSSGCDAWSTVTVNKNTLTRTCKNNESNSNETTTPTPSFYSATITATTNKLTHQQRQELLKSALAYARKTDQNYGLCAPESIHAWSIVDELYIAIPEYSAAVEESIRKVFGVKQNSIWDIWHIHTHRIIRWKVVGKIPSLTSITTLRSKRQQQQQQLLLLLDEKSLSKRTCTIQRKFNEECR